MIISGHVGPTHDQRGLAPQWRGCLGAPVLRRKGTDYLGTGRLRPPALPEIGPAANCVYRIRPANGIHAGGGRRRTRQAAGKSRAGTVGLVQDFGWLDQPHQRTHCRTGTLAARPDRVHRLRLPVARPLPVRKSRRPSRPPWPRSTRLDEQALNPDFVAHALSVLGPTLNLRLVNVCQSWRLYKLQNRMRRSF
jgi:hypothetical protein